MSHNMNIAYPSYILLCRISEGQGEKFDSVGIA